jgi:hypothetical protein
MNMLVERGLVPITPANDDSTQDAESIVRDIQSEQSQFELLEESQSNDIDQAPFDEFADFKVYEALRKEVTGFHSMDWSVHQLEVAAKIGMGPPRSL